MHRMWSTENLLELDRATTRLGALWEFWKWKWWSKTPEAKLVKNDNNKPAPTAKVVEQVVPVDIPCNKASGSFPELMEVAAAGEYVYRFGIINGVHQTEFHVSNVTIGTNPVHNGMWDYVVLRFKDTDESPVMLLGLLVLYACRFNFSYAECAERDSSNPPLRLDWKACADLLKKHFKPKVGRPSSSDFHGVTSPYVKKFVLNGAHCSVTILHIVERHTFYDTTLHFTLDQP
jgi:hypothetical protein